MDSKHISKIDACSLDRLFKAIYQTLKIEGKIINLPVETVKKKSAIAFAKGVWKDPVWSKIISAALIAISGYLFTLIIGHSKTEKPTAPNVHEIKKDSLKTVVQPAKQKQSLRK